MSHLVTLPTLSLELPDRPLDQDDMRTLIEVRVQRRLSLPALCEISLLDPSTELMQRAAASVGGPLRVILAGDENLFQGEVTAVEQQYGADGRQILRLRGYDLLHRLRKRQPVRAHIAVNLEQLAQQMVADLGLNVEFIEPSPSWRKLIQFYQSDLEFLTDLASRYGIFLTLRKNTLQGLTLAGKGDPVALRLGSSLLELRVEVNGDSACDSVAVSGWDPSRVELLAGSAQMPRVGAAILQADNMANVAWGAPCTLADETMAGDAHAALLAQGELDRRAARQLTLWGVAEGNAELWPGTIIDVAGIAANLEGAYVVTSVSHRIDPRVGFVSEFSTMPPPPPSRARGAMITWGTVSRIDDPDGLGRICVALPSFGQVETDWMGVVAPGAGSGKGLLSLPDVGDQVLVVFPNENPEHGVVMGGLYGAQSPPDQAGIEQGSVRRFTLVTPGGQRLQLDDTRKVIRMENVAGSFVELSPDLVRLHARADLSLEAPGQNVFIRGQKIHFEQQ